MCLYDLRQHRIRIGMSAELSALAIYLIAVFILPLKGIGNLLWIPTMCIVIYVFANSHGFIASNSDNKIVSFLGAISMEIYIYQLISIRFVGTMLSFVPGGGSPYPIFNAIRPDIHSSISNKYNISFLYRS